MLQKYDPITSNKMKEMMSLDRGKIRHMWILRSPDKKEDTFDAVMRKSFGYYLKRRNERYLFDLETEGLFICLLKENDGKTIHAVAVERSTHSLLYDFEDEHLFIPSKMLDNFHSLCNSRKCVGVQIVAEIIPPKKKSSLFPFT
jgi:hypothetical protein